MNPQQLWTVQTKRLSFNSQTKCYEIITHNCCTTYTTEESAIRFRNELAQIKSKSFFQYSVVPYEKDMKTEDDIYSIPNDMKFTEVHKTELGSHREKISHVGDWGRSSPHIYTPISLDYFNPYHESTCYLLDPNLFNPFEQVRRTQAHYGPRHYDVHRLHELDREHEKTPSEFNPDPIKPKSKCTGLTKRKFDKKTQKWIEPCGCDLCVRRFFKI